MLHTSPRIKNPFSFAQGLHGAELSAIFVAKREALEQIADSANAMSGKHFGTSRPDPFQELHGVLHAALFDELCCLHRISDAGYRKPRIPAQLIVGLYDAASGIAIGDRNRNRHSVFNSMLKAESTIASCEIRS